MGPAEVGWAQQILPEWKPGQCETVLTTALLIPKWLTMVRRYTSYPSPVITETPPLRYGEKDDPALQMKIYSRLEKPNRTQRVYGLYWLCQAADQGYFQARLEVGNLYWRGQLNTRKDFIMAYVWYSLAAKVSNGDWDVWELRSVKNEMTPHQLAESEQMLADWEPGQCERDLASDSSRS